jgi:hypothetical protein
MRRIINYRMLTKHLDNPVTIIGVDGDDETSARAMMRA